MTPALDTRETGVPIPIRLFEQIADITVSHGREYESVLHEAQLINTHRELVVWLKMFRDEYERAQVEGFAPISLKFHQLNLRVDFDRDAKAFVIRYNGTIIYPSISSYLQAEQLLTSAY